MNANQIAIPFRSIRRDVVVKDCFINEVSQNFVSIFFIARAEFGNDSKAAAAWFKANNKCFN